MKIQEVETEYNCTVSQPQHQPTQVAAQVDTVRDSLHLCTISQYSYNSLEHEFIQRLSTISTIRYQIWENFGVEKIGKFGKQNACHSPILFPQTTSLYTQLQLYKQFICQYFILQLVRISSFVNILPHQNFPMYGSSFW